MGNKKVKKQENLPEGGDHTPQPPKKSLWARFMEFVRLVTDIQKVITAIGLAIGFIYGCVGHTTTSFTVLGTDGDSIIVKASMVGPKLRWSKLIDYRISFGNLPIEDATLKLIKGEETDAVVTSISSGIIHLTTPGLRALCRNPQVANLPGLYTKDEIMSQIPTQHVTVTISVRESNGAIRSPTEPVPAARVKEFILRHLPDHVPEETPCS